MTDHRCKACGWWLTTTDVPYGRVTLKCTNRRCGQRQTVEIKRDAAPDLQGARRP